MYVMERVSTVILDGYQAYTVCSANVKAAEVIVRRTTINRLATASNDSLHVESR